ncbi:hypothetical protein [Nocardia sp. NPDC051981]|uniref:hypothetical protein n=1 Tax=Nocardia sp. NPDC051981 TaxID=3155417 RepID=UPI00341E6E18
MNTISAPLTDSSIMLRRHLKRIARTPVAIFDAALMAVVMMLVSAYRILQVAEGAYYRWRNQFDGLEADGAKNIEDLEREESHPENAAGRSGSAAGGVEGDHAGNFCTRNAGRRPRLT